MQSTDGYNFYSHKDFLRLIFSSLAGAGGGVPPQKKGSGGGARGGGDVPVFCAWFFFISLSPLTPLKKSREPFLFATPFGARGINF